jgi:hypothetical protein
MCPSGHKLLPVLQQVVRQVPAGAASSSSGSGSSSGGGQQLL